MRASKRFLVVDGDPVTLAEIGELAKQSPIAHHWTLLTATDPGAALAVVRSEHVDVAASALHFGPNALQGAHLARAIRTVAQLPLLLYSTTSLQDDECAEMLLDGVEVMTSPLHGPSEFFARLELLTRRVSGVMKVARVSVGDLEVDPSGSVSLAGHPIKLSPQERTLLGALVAAAPALVAYHDLAHSLGLGMAWRRRSLLEAIRRLRSKVEVAGMSIEILSGLGARLTRTASRRITHS